MIIVGFLIGVMLPTLLLFGIRKVRERRVRRAQKDEAFEGRMGDCPVSLPSRNYHDEFIEWMDGQLELAEWNLLSPEVQREVAQFVQDSQPQVTYGYISASKITAGTITLGAPRLRHRMETP
jgi:hypothetical protein